MTPRKEFFIELKELTSRRVRMANKTQYDVAEISSIRFENSDGTTFVLNDVRYMPDK